MNVIHRIAFAATTAQRKELEELGVKVPSGIVMPGGGAPFVAFDVSEDHPSWGQVRALLQRWKISEGLVRTEFSKDEIEQARWLQIGAWHHGYPQPDEDVLGYREATYDLTDWCERCGIGKRQKAAFQMKGEPKWGHHGVLQLTWIYDELFVRPDVWSSVFEPHGISFRPVQNTKGAELETVVQLVVEERVVVQMDGLAFEGCSRCGRVKYLPVVRGRFPALKSEPTTAMAKTHPYFGSGGQADQRVIISQAVAKALASRKVRGPSLTPVGAAVT